ncbi:MAG: RecQ family ATP-dependent DNA helicase [Chitinophagaceae bacterium]|nr:MAG: RecQ family ATP-dependent DNA helicase [Chitinophagaceae bacterium]
MNAEDLLQDIHQILKRYWGFDAFRPLQENIIHSVLAGSDTLALMPTGGGKSLCYQVPAMAKDGLCLVISPLIALMKDQVEGLRRKNITAYAIYSGMTYKEVTQTLKVVTSSNCKFLYVSPERLETTLFKEYLPGMGISLVAVDEAHCISQWGYDFRPPYLRIAALRQELPGIPVLALTASATETVQKDICERLNYPEAPTLPEWKIFRQSFERANLSYSVFPVDSKINKAIEILTKIPGTGIIYCKSRKRTKEISELLQFQNISSDYYHAGLTQEDRSRKQEAWLSDKIRVIVCTNAFGMGIDKPDVRTVIHVDTPDCLENYYQEAGRAGRDGKKSYAVLLYHEKDLLELEEMISVRFPSLEQIRNVYHAMSNYLQLPAGIEPGEYYDFDMGDFVRKFKLEPQTTLYALKALEQDGWIAMNEQVYKHGTVCFKASRHSLQEFENTKPHLEPLIKTMLRSYEGIFDQSTFISELLLAQLLKKDAAEIKQHLNELHLAGIIEYVPRKESPQLSLLRRRVKTEELSIDMKQYELRKTQFRQRAKVMISYVREQKECRSQVIGRYFGDSGVRRCDVCDNCLREKSLHISREDFENISRQIESMLANRRVLIKELIGELKQVKKEKAWKVIEFLQSEKKVQVDATGWVSLVTR